MLYNHFKTSYWEETIKIHIVEMKIIKNIIKHSFAFYT